MKKWLAAFAILILMVFLSTPTTTAAHRSQLNKGASATNRLAGALIQIHPNATVRSCSQYDCDDLYAYPQPSNVDGTNCGGSWLGWLPGEHEWSKMYYSSSCGTNFAYVTSSPDGSAIIEVLLQRKQPHDSGCCFRGEIVSFDPTYIGNGTLSPCLPTPRNYSDSDSFCDPDTIPDGAHSWLGNMLYAPVDQVRVCVATVNNPHNPVCSLWH